jgi:hypothetical protein
MPNPLYNQLQGSQIGNPMMQKLMEFKKTFNGNPQQMIQQMLNSGRINQAQLNQYIQQTNEIYKQLGNLMK